MNEEKMMILKMLEQGKITSEEAAQLLSALKDKSTNREKSKPQYQNTSSYSRDFGKKVEALSKDLEPKIKKATQTILDKTAYFADKISKSLSESNSFSSFKGEQEKKLELLVGYKENAHLRLNGKNGMIYVKGYNGDKITAKVTYTTKGESHIIELVEVGNTSYLNYDEAYFDTVSIEAFVPEKLFSKIFIETSNEKVHLENLTADYLEVDSSNGSIEVKQCDVTKMEIDTSDANILLDATTVELKKSYEYEWSADTSNGTVQVNTLKDSMVGYELEASASLNGVQVNLPNMIYKENEKNYVKGSTNNYSMASRRIKLDVETSNAPIIIA